VPDPISDINEGDVDMLRTSCAVAALGAMAALAGCGGGGSSGSDPGIEPNVAYVRNAPGTGQGGWGQSIATFADDSYVVVGGFDATLTLGDGQPNETVLTAAGPSDAFVARYAADGTFVWARQIESVEGVYAKDVDVLADGSIGVAGWFTGDATLAPGEANEVTHDGTIGSWQTSFVARYTGVGDLVWSRAFGGLDGDVTMQEVAGTTDGQLVVAGYANAPHFVLGEGEANETVVDIGAIESVVAKYDAATGDLAWARVTESSSGTSAWAIDDMPAGGVAVFGRFRGTTDFDGVIGTATPNSRDNWIVVYDAAGVAQWIRTLGSEMTENPYDLATSPGGLIAVTGEYDDHTIAGVESGSPQTLASPGVTRNTYVALYGPAGDFRWLRGVQNATTNSHGEEIAFSPDGGVLVAGYFIHTVTLGLGEPTQTTLTIAPAVGNAFLARWTPAGALDWAQHVSDPEESGIYGVAALSDDSPITAGYFLSTCTWGAGDPNETTLVTTTSYEMFVARHNPDGGF